MPLGHMATPPSLKLRGTACEAGTQEAESDLLQGHFLQVVTVIAFRIFHTPHSLFLQMKLPVLAFPHCHHFPISSLLQIFLAPSDLLSLFLILTFLLLAPSRVPRFFSSCCLIHSSVTKLVCSVDSLFSLQGLGAAIFPLPFALTAASVSPSVSRSLQRLRSPTSVLQVSRDPTSPTSPSDPDVTLALRPQDGARRLAPPLTSPRSPPILSHQQEPTKRQRRCILRRLKEAGTIIPEADR